jgi:hypothetical protein
LKKRKKKISSKAFVDALVNEVPKFDEMILKDIRWSDSWVGLVSAEPYPSWWERLMLWIAGKILFLSLFLDRIQIKIRGRFPKPEVEIKQDRFKNVWKNTTKNWKPVKPKKRRNRHEPKTRRKNGHTIGRRRKIKSLG